MFSNLFHYDNPVMRFFGKLCDIMILNVLWILCSLPIVTIGASTTAVYYVTLSLTRDDDKYTVRSFFKSFKENFKQATALWGILGLIGLVIQVDLYYYLQISTSPIRKTALVIFAIALLLWYGLLMYVFPLQARFENPIRRTLWNAVLIAIRHLPQTFVMVMGDLAILVVMFCFLPGLLVLGIPLVAFYNSYFMTPIFAKYSPKEEWDEDEEEE